MKTSILNKILKSEILYEDNHLLIINKRAGVLSQGDITGDASIIDLCKQYIKEAYNKPGNVYLGLPHRLDRPVSGVIISCKTSKSLERVNRMIKKREIRKIYHALCLGPPPNTAGTVESYLRKERNINKVFSFGKEVEGSKKAVLHYRYLRETKGHHHLLEVELQTGRPHQIRVQLNAIGCPILGDFKYKKQDALSDRSIALHARRIEFNHPVGGETLNIIAAYPTKNWWDL